jgi:Amt family ammonium transporter
VGALSWLALDYLLHKKMSLLGLVTGAIVGLVAITPAAGYVGLNAAFVLPVVAVLCSMISLSVIKNTLRIDDAFDVFAIHGVAGLVGTLLTPIFAFSTYSEVLRRLFANTLGATAILIYAALMTAVILWILKPITGWRVEPVEEKVGLDLTQLSETIVSER